MSAARAGSSTRSATDVTQRAATVRDRRFMAVRNASGAGPAPSSGSRSRAPPGRSRTLRWCCSPGPPRARPGTGGAVRPRACCEPGAPPCALLLLEQKFETSGGRDELTHPRDRIERGTPGPARPGPGRVRTRAAAARQVALQRRGYAAAVLRALARNQRGRTTAQIQRTLRDSLTPLGLRLSPAALHQLATDIAAGRPVELP